MASVVSDVVKCCDWQLLLETRGVRVYDAPYSTEHASAHPLMLCIIPKAGIYRVVQCALLSDI